MKIALAAVAEVKLVVLGMHFAWLVRAIKCVSFM
jgi:hypothetical protein